MPTRVLRRHHPLVWTLLALGALGIGAAHGGLAILTIAAVIMFILL